MGELSAEAPSTRPPPLPEITQLGLITLLLALAAVGWVVTDDRMAGMNTGPGVDLGMPGFYVITWVVMMAAMMFPSITPMVLMYARIQRGKRQRAQPVLVGATAAFVAGYLIAWTAVGLVFYAMISLGSAVDLRLLGWDQAGPYIAGGVIAAAGLYQFTPAKQACLRKCRGPFEFLLSCWRPGRTGALWMGIKHGGWCVGCCWALMAALFALGVMSIGWMAFIAALIAIEKLLPWRVIASRGVAVVLLVLGLSVALLPHDVPDVRSPAPNMQMAVT